MKIECHKCNAVYEVDARRIPAQGLSMQCPRCLVALQVAPTEKVSSEAEQEVIDFPGLPGQIRVKALASPLPPEQAEIVDLPAPKALPRPPAPMITPPPPADRTREAIVLPAPIEATDPAGGEIVDLPAPKSAGLQQQPHRAPSPIVVPPPTLHSTPGEITDLPAPKGAVKPARSVVPAEAAGEVDLPAPKRAVKPARPVAPAGTSGEVDLPAPKRAVKPARPVAPAGAAGQANLPTPKYPNASPKDHGRQLPRQPSTKGSPLSAEIVDLPSPKDVFVDRPPAHDGHLFPAKQSVSADEIIDLPEPQDGIVDLLEPRVDVVDLLEPREGIVDLPEPRSEIVDLPEPRGGIVDLPEPRGGIVDLPEPRGGIVDLPQPRQHNAPRADPAAHAAQDYGQLELDDNGDDSGIELDELPVPPGSATAFTKPSRSARTGTHDPGDPGAGQDQAEAGDAELELLEFAPPEPDEENSLPPEHTPSLPVEEEVLSRKERRAGEAVPRALRKIYVARPRGKKILLWTLISIVVFIVVAGMAIGIILPDYGFFGLRLFSGAYDKARQAHAAFSSAQIDLTKDTYQGYRRAAEGFAEAVPGLPDPLEAQALQVQALAALSIRFGVDNEQLAKAEEVLGALAEVDAPTPQLEKARALVALAKSDVSGARDTLRALSDQEPGDMLAALYLGWACLAQQDLKGAADAFSRALAARSDLPGALYGQAQLSFKLMDTPRGQQWLRQTLRAESSHPDALLYSARQLIEQGKQKEARVALGHLLRLGPDAGKTTLSQAQSALGELLRQEGLIDQARQRFTTSLQTNPKNASAHLGLGRLLLAAGKNKEALEKLRQAQSLDPAEGTIAIELTQALIAAEKPQEARQALASLIKSKPHAPEVLFLRGRIDEALQEHTSAERFFRQAISKQPDYLLPYLHLSRLFLKQGRLKEAAQPLQQAKAKLPAAAVIHLALGEVALAKKQLDQALRSFEEAVRLEPNNNNATFKLARLLMQQGKLEQAKEQFLAVEKRDKGYPGLHVQLGELFLALKDYQNTAAQYDEALGLDTPTTTLRLAAVRSFLLARQGEKAAELANLIMNENPTLMEAKALHAEARFISGFAEEAVVEIQQTINREKKPEYYTLLGTIFEAQKKNADAVAAYQESLKLNAQQPMVELRLGVVLVKSGMAKDGLAALNNAIAENPQLAEPYLYLGDAQADLGHEAKAVQAYQKAVQRDPQLGQAHFKLAQLYVDQRKRSMALTHLLAATKAGKTSDPWLPDAYYLLGNTARELGHEKQAVEAYTTFLQLAPPASALSPDVKKKLGELKAPRR